MKILNVTVTHDLQMAGNRLRLIGALMNPFAERLTLRFINANVTIDEATTPAESTPTIPPSPSVPLFKLTEEERKNLESACQLARAAANAHFDLARFLRESSGESEAMDKAGTHFSKIIQTLRRILNFNPL